LSDYTYSSSKMKLSLRSERNFKKVENYFPKIDNERASRRGDWRENSVKEQSNDND